MGDRLTPESRSSCMRAVRSKDTSAELQVRSLVHKLGFRYSLHDARLPGKPDLVLRSRRKIIFVHGCFWHRHSCRHGSISPKTNADYWNAKRERNVQRDALQSRLLRADGWQVLIVWECQLKYPDRLSRRLQRFLTNAEFSAGSRSEKSRVLV